MYGWGMGFVEQSGPQVGPIQTAAPAANAGPTAPTGDWVNPSNPTQWLTQSDAGKIGGWCFNPVPGIYQVGGNYGDSQLYCGRLSATQNIAVYGGVAALLAFALPGGYKWLAVVPAAYGALGATLGQVVL